MVHNDHRQLLCLIAMDPLSEISVDSVRDEKVKVLRALVPVGAERIAHHAVRGQYGVGHISGHPVPGYLDEASANRESETETLVAVRAQGRNRRWAGVPFYLRTGKRMPETLSQIVIHFKAPPHYIFGPEQRALGGNKLTIRLQPDESPWVLGGTLSSKFKLTTIPDV